VSTCRQQHSIGGDQIERQDIIAGRAERPHDDAVKTRIAGLSLGGGNGWLSLGK
jgi:hypothetical protein